MNVGRIELVGPFSGEHYSIYCGQMVLTLAKAFSNDTFNGVAVIRPFYMLFSNNQPESGFLSFGWASE